jgi:hypothetical protein
MFILIEYSYDASSTTLFSDIVKANDAFDKACEDPGFNLGIYLIKPTEGVPFGFDTRDQFVGAEVIRERSKNLNCFNN